MGSIEGMKVSVSLSASDLAFVDEYVRTSGAPSRSAVLHEAVRLLRERQLGDAYEEAWDEWSASDDAAAWDRLSAEGLVPDATR
jgi:Arc/MetJ-type ribon-helix-helix transcriptional regulator